MSIETQTDLRELLITHAIGAGIGSTKLVESLSESQHDAEVLLDHSVLHDDDFASLTYFTNPSSETGEKVTSIIGIMNMHWGGGTWFVYASKEYDNPASEGEISITFRRIADASRSPKLDEEFSMLLLLAQIFNRS